MMNGDSASKEPSASGFVNVNVKQLWKVSPSDVFNHFGTSGISVAAATAITHPLAFQSDGSTSLSLSRRRSQPATTSNGSLCSRDLIIGDFDVLKVRLQMQFVGQKGPLTGMRQVFVQVVKNEGPRSLYLGLSPALTRSVLYGGLRLGLYEPSKYFCKLAFDSTNILVKIASAAFSGALATALTNPMEVLKVRRQMNPNMRKGALAEMQKISSKEGIAALWKGVGPAMARAAALTASQLATYDEFKRGLIKWTPLEEGFYLHLISSTVAGTVSTLVTAPMDMIKTRLMLQQDSRRFGTYRNGFHCAYQVMLTEGPRGLYKGGLAIFARLGPQTTITFIICEKLRELAGLKAI